MKCFLYGAVCECLMFFVARAEMSESEHFNAIADKKAPKEWMDRTQGSSIKLKHCFS